MDQDVLRRRPGLPVLQPPEQGRRGPVHPEDCVQRGHQRAQRLHVCPRYVAAGVQAAWGGCERERMAGPQRRTEQARVQGGSLPPCTPPDGDGGVPVLRACQHVSDNQSMT